ncbi:MAG: FAD-dependent oxidoreductase [Bacteroidota bacterium]
MARPDYDLLVLGGGAAGLTASGVGVHLGARTLLVERHRLGGDCTWTGCVPSKALLHDAARAHAARSVLTEHAAAPAGDGQPADASETDALGAALFESAMRRLRHVRQEVYDEADAPERIGRFGIEIATGDARFVGEREVEIEGEHGRRRVTARRVVIATGGRPVVPPVEGLDEVGAFTNETLFEIDRRPDRLAVLGAGPIGIEMAQAFARFGTAVTVIDRSPVILGRDDAELADRLRGLLEAEGIRFRLGQTVSQASRTDGVAHLVLEDGSTVEADVVLVAAGRAPNVDGLGLDAAGVEVTRGGIVTDASGRTTARGVYAAGDCADGPRLTHWAEHAAKTAVTSALLRLPARQDPAHLPWVTYTSPELAQVGATAAELEARGEAFETIHLPTRLVDRAVAEGAVCEVKVHVRGGRILGASVLAERAGEMISELAVAMRNGVPLRKLSDTVHPYPSYGLAVRRAADQWYVRRQSPRLVRALQRVFGYRGPVLSHTPGDVL